MTRLIDITGQRFDRLVVVSRALNSKTGSARWLCRCDCGGEKITSGGALRIGDAKSCGCLNRELRAERARKLGYASRQHGHSVGGPQGGTRTYASWLAMRCRCLTTTDFHYPDYGGRGISICDRWVESFDLFLADMGERPTGMTLDRINNDGNYEPSNCRWATPSEQALNRRPPRNHPKRLLDPERVLQIRSLYDEGWAAIDIAHAFGVSDGTICSIGLRKSWATVPEQHPAVAA